MGNQCLVCCCRLLILCAMPGLGAVSPKWVLHGDEQQHQQPAATLTVSRDMLRCLGPPASPAGVHEQLWVVASLC